MSELKTGLDGYNFVSDREPAGYLEDVKAAIEKADALDPGNGSDNNKKVVDDLSGMQDKDVISNGLRRMQRRMTVKIVFMSILLAASVYMFAGRFEALSVIFPFALSPKAPSLLHLYVLLSISLIAFLLNVVPLFAGISRVFKGRITVDGMSLFLGLSVFGYNAYFLFHPEAFAGVRYITFDVLFILSLTLNLIRKRKMVKSLRKGFEIISDKREKTVVSKPQNITVGNDVMAEIGIGGDILYASRADLVKGFVQQEFEEMESSAGLDPFRFFVTAALLLFVGAVLLAGQIAVPYALFVLTAGFALVSPCLCALTYIDDVVRLNRKLFENDTVISGVKGARELADAGILVVGERELLSGKDVRLIGKKFFQTQEKSGILNEIAAILSKPGGCLFEFFRDMLPEERRGSATISDFVSCGRIGYSAVVNGKKALLGSRDLMIKAGVSTPRVEAAASQYAVYYAADGVLKAVFLISYSLSSDSREALSILDRHGIATGIAGASPHLEESFYTDDIELSAPENIALLSPSTSAKCASHCGHSHSARAEIATLRGLRGIASGFLGMDKLLLDSLVRNTFQIVSALFALTLIVLRTLLFRDADPYIIYRILIYQALWNIPLFIVGRSNKV